jgi:predicted glycosyltransferase
MRDNGENMKIWYDACTGKHIRYGVAIARRLRQLGHEVILTTRDHPDTLALANILGEKFISVGKYKPTSLLEKLEESTNRMLKLTKIIKNGRPDVAISHQSVDLCRVAFGLDIPTILTADTPHATAVNKLTLPLADAVVVSEAIPKRFFKNYGVKKVVQFRGVDEAAWMKEFKSSKNSGFEKPLIVVRQMETKASYALGKSDVTEEIAQKLTSLGHVLFLSRYGEVKKKGYMVTEEFVDSASLVSSADIVLSIGGTITREAALQGVPSMVISEFGQTHVNRYLAEKGFPLFIIDAYDVVTFTKKYLGRKWDVKEKLGKLENPVRVIEKIIGEKQFTQKYVEAST